MDTGYGSGTERETHGKRLGSFLNDEAFDKVSEDLRFDHSLGERSSRVGQGQRECRWSGERDLWSYTDRQTGNYIINSVEVFLIHKFLI